MRQEKEIKSIQIGKNKLNYLYLQKTVIYVENLRTDVKRFPNQWPQRGTEQGRSWVAIGERALFLFILYSRSSFPPSEPASSHNWRPQVGCSSSLTDVGTEYLFLI